MQLLSLELQRRNLSNSELSKVIKEKLTDSRPNFSFIVSICVMCSRSNTSKISNSAESVVLYDNSLLLFINNSVVSLRISCEINIEVYNLQ